MDVITAGKNVSVHLYEPGKNVLIVAVKDNSIGTESIVYENALKKAIRKAIGGEDE